MSFIQIVRVKNIDDDFRDKYPQIPWKKIAGMRDIITHEYFGVKFDRVRDVMKKDLPDLKKKIGTMGNKEDAR